MPFEYPDHPNRNRVDPTRNGVVENPFADSTGGPADEIAENPYTASTVDDPVPYQPRDFQTTYGHRGGLICTLGVAGLVSWIVAGTGLIVAMFSRQSVGGALFSLSTAVLMLGLPLGWSAWLMGRHDLAAMAAGAMTREGRRGTRIGCWSGMFATLGGWGGVLLLVLLTIISIIQEG